MIDSDSTICEPPAGFTAADDRVHRDATIEEWTFSWWAADGSMAGHTMYRLHDKRSAWYCWGLSRAGEPYVQVVECDITRRADPMIGKAEAFWAEYTCESSFEQWTVGNETYAVELDDPVEGLGRGYGNAVPIASDLEWYATERAVPITDGYSQHGVLMGDIETVRGVFTIPEVTSMRTHRWTSATALPPIFEQSGVAHFGRRLTFRFADESHVDLVLGVAGLVRRS
ncbi:MAG: hypothetical protein ACO3TP_07305 [Ilumatobacteraceae bacterium]